MIAQSAFFRNETGRSFLESDPRTVENDECGELSFASASSPLLFQRLPFLQIPLAGNAGNGPRNRCKTLGGDFPAAILANPIKAFAGPIGGVLHGVGVPHLDLGKKLFLCGQNGFSGAIQGHPEVIARYKDASMPDTDESRKSGIF